MRRDQGWLLGAAAALAFLLGAGPGLADCDNHGVILADGEKIDLADLYDGETRTFGEGDRRITATRYGDTVEVTLEGLEDTKTIECSIGQDSCVVLLSEDGGSGRVMVMKHRTGEAHLEDILSLDAGEGNIFFQGEDGHAMKVLLSSDGHDGALRWISEDGKTLDGQAFKLRRDGGTTLRCPEGDTIMTLEKGEENAGPFYCPRHDVELQKTRGHVMIKEIRLSPHEEH